MARVTYDPVELGPSAAADVNDIFTAIETQTTNLTAANFEEEGLDERAFATTVQAARGFTAITETTRSRTQALSSTWATLEPSGGSQFRTGGIVIGTEERLYVVIRIELLSDATQEGIPYADLQIRWRDSVSGPVGTTRRVKATTTVMGNTTGGPYCLSHQIVIDGAKTVDWLEVQISDQAGTATVQYGDISMYGMLYKRVTV